MRREPGWSARDVSPVARVLLVAVRTYKRWISPLLPRACRFEPTCSVYAAEAVTRYGAWRGVTLAVKRLARCRPGCPGGYDPVPLPPDTPDSCPGQD
ncbi:MAG: membrane protein insertion efficiency factor YidD [Planctomycetes bacterium]|nr:membrane protein insertion efficiency factor YidD [Planctomycetota bacterium]